jgi:hypothetical protein
MANPHCILDLHQLIQSRTLPDLSPFTYSPTQPQKRQLEEYLVVTNHGLRICAKYL